ncbi:hypothetical protein O181_067317 [Austropuccinia psidii MF-1]|uniref:Uncharacterized protein n=1 Tax=Austropuccinia psidii MF-1 TaxID=1389203 RepID=A0A9Q3EX47_9BASI|nr:hypothetical protein [Austropuccinia psidii MF-1]
MPTSKPYTEKIQNTLPRRVNLSSQIPTTLNQETPRNTTPIMKIKAKVYSLWFDGKYFKRFIKKVENIAEIERESGRGIARHIAFWTNDEEISYHIEGMPEYETAYWDQFKVDIKRRWGKVSPEKKI